MSLYEMLKAKVDALSDEFLKAKERVKKAQDEADELQEKRDSFVSALRAEMEERGIPYRIASKVPMSEERGSKTRFIKEFVFKHSADGVKPSDVIKELERVKMDVHPNYAYAVLLRLKVKGEVIEDNGRYYPKS
jgi:hypothetical protein